MDYSLESMSASHRLPIIDIFNHFIRKSHGAFLTEPVGYEFFDQLLKISGIIQPWWSGTQPQRIVGFAFLRPITRRMPSGGRRRSPTLSCRNIPARDSALPFWSCS